eukprot:CAMPEP_0114234572 /NCGR_PEP_ID=MMETSP0058-20121206/5779_1 /TAXON_ID=36894 /ORGANISM="Pyramimonas parkeae, CCMP726" /LENGTH=312 /DNA_ID=CAMNT_0001346257 /DNA_START=4 /DNA_END=942 /DNA_ORIENTATION=-
MTACVMPKASPSLSPFRTPSRQRFSKTRAYTNRVTATDGRSLVDRVKNPVDALTLVPRIVLGGSLDLFAALSEPGGIQKQMEEFNIFLQDPRPIEEKAAGVTGELEGLLLEAADKGEALESAALQVVEAQLQDMGIETQAIRAGVARALPYSQAGLPGAADPASARAAESAPPSPSAHPSQELKRDSKETLAGRIQRGTSNKSPRPAAPPMDAATREALQRAAEVDQIRREVARIRETIVEISEARKSGAVGKIKMKAITLKERRNALSRLLQQSDLSMQASNNAVFRSVDNISSVVEQAEQLVKDVDSLDI